MAKKKSRVPKDESKRDKFKRIVQQRMTSALKSIRLIGNCASPAYEYTAADIAHMITTLQNAVEGLEGRFESKGEKDTGFTF